MLKKILLFSILWVLLPFTIWCSERAGRPVQLQLVNFSGVALGYHISDSIYLGYTYVSSMDLSLEPQNPRALYGQDYVEKVDVEEDQDQSIELSKLANKIAKLFKRKVQISKVGLETNKIDKYVPNISKTKYDLKIKILYNLSKSLKKCLKFI